MMKSMLLNEWITFRHATKSIVLALVFALVILIPSFMEDSTMKLVALVCLLTTLPCMLAPATCIQGFSVDEKSHWQEALLSMPTAPESMVRARYLFCLAALAAFSALSLIADLIGIAALGESPAAFLTEELYIFPAVIICFALVLLAYLMPFLYAFGQKGLLSILILPAIAIAASFAGPGAAAPADFIHSCPKGTLAAGFICAGLALYALSCLISSAILKRRSF
ncbi:MAG: ABC-2 transporter permease [Atopobiaceae bacterium]